MKQIMKKLKMARAKAFTLVEMLIVLLIVSVLLLLFVPNLGKQKEKIEASGNAALVKVVESQAELYELNSDDAATLGRLVAEEYISEEQATKYRAYYETNPGQQVPD